MFDGKSKSKYSVREGAGGATLGAIELWGSFSFMSRSHNMIEDPISRWGHDGNGNQFCILHFDIQISEGTRSYMFRRASVGLDFDTNEQNIRIQSITPEREQVRRLAGKITQGYNIEPNVDFGVGGGGLGSYHRDADIPGPLDWRFFGNRGGDWVDWTWMCERSYSTAQGAPSPLVGVVIPLQNHEVIKCNVSMKVSPRHFWHRIGNPIINFPMEFIPPPRPNEKDISNHIRDFQRSFRRRDPNEGDEPALGA